MKPSIVHCHVTGDRILVDDNTYRNLTNATERHAVYQIRVDLKANKDPLSTVGRKRTSEVAALQRNVEELSACVAITLATVLNMTTTVARDNTLTKLTAAPTRISLGLFASLTLTRNRKALETDRI